MTLTEIKERNKQAGYHFFSPDTMRFFRSRIGCQIYEGIGGIYFITSEQFVMYHPEYYAKPRKYSVRQFNPETGDIHTVGEFNKLPSWHYAAKEAKRLAEGLQPLPKDIRKGHVCNDSQL